jgi:two-component sensor histidine kinase
LEEARNFLFDFAKKYPPIDPYGKASLARTFAYYYNSIRDYSRADKYAQEMISLEPSLGKDNEIRRDVEYDIGEYYFNKKQFAKAKTYFEKALDEAVLNNSANTIKDVNLMLFEADSSLGNYISAIRHLNQFRQLNDSIFNETKSKQITEVQAKYETEKKEQNIKLLENESKLQQNELLQASHTRNWILAAVVLLLIIAGLMFRNLRLKQRTNRKLEVHEKEIEKQNNTLRHLVYEKDSLLKEKEWLIKEIHHRVKNNLQMVISLLNAQTEFLNNPAAINAIKESRERMQAIAIIHQKLYKIDNSTEVNMRSYINELVENIKNSFADTERIYFKLEIDDVALDISQSVPLGLILNEAITNAVKYAYPENEKGVIQVSLKHHVTDRLQLKIEDNGRGLPPGLNIEQSNSLGLQLIRLFSEQLEGELYFVNNNGLEMILNFKTAEHKNLTHIKASA